MYTSDWEESNGKFVVKRLIWGKMMSSIVVAET